MILRHADTAGWYDTRRSSVTITSDATPTEVLRADIDRVWFGLYTFAAASQIALAPSGLTPVGPGVGVSGIGVPISVDIPGVQMSVDTHGALVSLSWSAIVPAPLPVPNPIITVLELILRRPPRWISQVHVTRSLPSRLR